MSELSPRQRRCRDRYLQTLVQLRSNWKLNGKRRECESGLGNVGFRSTVTPLKISTGHIISAANSVMCLVFVQSVDLMCWLLITGVIAGFFCLFFLPIWQIVPAGCHPFSAVWRTLMSFLHGGEQPTWWKPRGDVGANVHIEVSGSSCHGITALPHLRFLW